MRNLKKILALALALVMTLSVMSVAGAKKLGEYSDSASVDAKYTRAVDVVSQLNILEGDNGFRPTGSLTRAELAAIIYRVTTGDVNDVYSGNFVAGASANFADVSETAWYAGYVGYCADAGYLEGWDGRYWPSDTLTGYQALAALLRAIGYNQPDEFSGSAWKVRVAQIANETGVSAGVITDLNKAVTREQTAMFIYNALFANKVRYNAVSYYVPTGSNLALDVFDVVTDKNGKAGEADVWGHPSTVWEDAAGNNLVSIAMEADATYYTMVDECDIAHDLGLTRTTAIEAAYIDGQEYPLTSADVTSNQAASINPYSTTSMVGAQGRITKVYNMGRDGIRLVEINTYLAQVAAIIPATSDKNQHPVPAYSVLNVFVPEFDSNTATSADARDDGILVDRDANPTDGSLTADHVITMHTYDTSNAVGSWVLVTANPATVRNSLNRDNGEVASVEPATVGGAAVMAGYTIGVDNATTGTTTMGTTAYLDADKFVYISSNHTTPGADNDDLATHKPTALAGTYTVITDGRGNLIGLAPVTTNYLVIEQVRWVDDNTVTGGKALANIVLADGSKLSNVVINSVTNVAGTAMVTARNVDLDSSANQGAFSDAYNINTWYYDHIWQYTVNADGSYNLIDAPCTVDYNDTVDSGDQEYETTDDVDIVNGVVTVNSQTNLVVATDNTVFLVQNRDGYTYTVYTGKANVPNMLDAEIHWITSGGFITLMVVETYTPASDSFVAWYADTAYESVSTTPTGTTIYSYTVYKLGETTPTTIWSANNNLNGEAAVVPGFYTVTLAGGVATLADAKGGTADTPMLDTSATTKRTATKDGKIYDLAFYRSMLGNSMQTVTDTPAAYKDYDTTNTKYVLVTDYGTYVTVSEGSAAWLPGSKIAVVDNNAGDGRDTANYVYIFTTATPDVSEVNHNVWALNLTQTAPGAAVVANFRNYDTVHTAAVAEVKYFYRVAGSTTGWSVYADDNSTSGWTASTDATTALGTGVSLPGASTTQFEVYAVAYDALGRTMATSATGYFFNS